MNANDRKQIAAALRQERKRWNKYTKGSALSRAARAQWRLRRLPNERRDIVAREEATRDDVRALDRWYECTEDETHDPARIAELREELEARLAAFPPREASATLRHLAHGQLLREIGDAEGITRERVRQIVEECSEVLRWHLRRA